MSRKKKIKTRDARLSVMPNPNNRGQAIKSEMSDSKTEIHEVSHTAGRKGYAEKCKGMGLFFQVCACIRTFRINNPDTSAKDLYKELHIKYPMIFEAEPEDIYGSNFLKVIQAEPAFCKAYYSNGVNLVELAEYRLQLILDDENTETKDVISAYDKVKKYSLAERQLSAAANTDSEIVVEIDKSWEEGEEPCILN